MPVKTFVLHLSRAISSVFFLNATSRPDMVPASSQGELIACHCSDPKSQLKKQQIPVPSSSRFLLNLLGSKMSTQSMLSCCLPIKAKSELCRRRAVQAVLDTIHWKLPWNSIEIVFRTSQFMTECLVQILQMSLVTDQGHRGKTGSNFQRLGRQRISKSFW